MCFSIWFAAGADAGVGCSTIMPILGEPPSGPSTMPMDLKFGIFSGLSTRCLTDPPPTIDLFSTKTKPAS